MTVLDMISTGAAVIVQGHYFTVGNYVPDFKAWELVEYDEVVVTVRAKVLAEIIEVMWWPEAAA